MNEDIISVEYIDPKEWNKKLVELNNGERARYYEHAYAVEKIPTMPHLTGVPKKFEWEDTSKKVYYTVYFDWRETADWNWKATFKFGRIK